MTKARRLGIKYQVQPPPIFSKNPELFREWVTAVYQWRRTTSVPSIYQGGDVFKVLPTDVKDWVLSRLDTRRVIGTNEGLDTLLRLLFTRFNNPKVAEKLELTPQSVTWQFEVRVKTPQVKKVCASPPLKSTYRPSCNTLCYSCGSDIHVIRNCPHLGDDADRRLLWRFQQQNQRKPDHASVIGKPVTSLEAKTFVPRHGLRVKTRKSTQIASSTAVVEYPSFGNQSS